MTAVRWRFEWDRVERGREVGTHELVFPTPADARRAAAGLMAAADMAEIDEELT